MVYTVSLYGHVILSDKTVYNDFAEKEDLGNPEEDRTDLGGARLECGRVVDTTDEDFFVSWSNFS